MLDSETKNSFHDAVTVDQTPRILPREIVVEKIRDGVRYRLPMRRIGMIRLVGLIPIAFALVFMLTPVFWFGPFLKDAFTHPNFFHLFFALFLAFWFYGASKPLTFGLLILGGRCRVELTREWLRAVDSSGPFRIARRARREDIKWFSVDVSNDKPMPRFLSALRLLGGLEAKFEKAKAMPVAVAYPREWLTALGDALTHQINEANIVHAAAPLPATTEVVKKLSSELIAPLATDDVPTQPSGSDVRIEQSADCLSITVPPAGIWRGSKGLFLFGIAWCAFMTIFNGAMFLPSHKPSSSILGFLLVSIVFWAIGIGMLLGAINMAGAAPCWSLLRETCALPRTVCSGGNFGRGRAKKLLRSESIAAGWK